MKFKADVLGCSIGSINMLLESACNAVAFSGTYSPQALDCTVGFAMTCHAGPKAAHPNEYCQSTSSPQHSQAQRIARAPFERSRFGIRPMNRSWGA